MSTCLNYFIWSGDLQAKKHFGTRSPLFPKNALLLQQPLAPYFWKHSPIAIIVSTILQHFFPISSSCCVQFHVFHFIQIELFSVGIGSPHCTVLVPLVIPAWTGIWKVLSVHVYKVRIQVSLKATFSKHQSNLFAIHGQDESISERLQAQSSFTMLTLNI